jgi:hypothetical protein
MGQRYGLGFLYLASNNLYADTLVHFGFAYFFAVLQIDAKK